MGVAAGCFCLIAVMACWKKGRLKRIYCFRRPLGSNLENCICAFRTHILIEFKFYMGYGLLCRLLSRCRSGFGFRQGRRLLGQMADFLFVVDDGDADTGVSVDWVLTSTYTCFT